MKKFLAIAMIITLSCTLVSCGRLMCNGCGKISLEEKHKVKYFGQEAYLCDECKEMIEPYEDSVEKIFPNF